MADGTIRTYEYPRPGPGTDLGRRRRADPGDAIPHLSARFRAAPEYRRTSARWQAVTDYYLAILADELKGVPLAALSHRDARGAFYELRDRHAAWPNKADKLMATLRRLLSWAYERALIDANHAHGIAKLTRSNRPRADIVWSAEQEAALLQAAESEENADLYRFALLTGLRQSDICRVRRAQFDGQWLTVKPAKTAKSSGVSVYLPVFALPALADLLARQTYATEYLLTTARGHPWTPENVKRAFRRDKLRAGLEDRDLTFHDLRGTLVTRLYEASATDAEVKAIIGHVIGGGETASYAARSKRYAVNAYRKLATDMAAQGAPDGAAVVDLATRR